MDPINVLEIGLQRLRSSIRMLRELEEIITAINQEGKRI